MDTAEIWDEFSAGLRRYIAVRVPSEADADDVLQSVFATIHARRDQLRDEARVAGWVYRIASNEVHDFWRSTARTVVQRPPPEDDERARATLAECIRPFVDTLDEPYREALTLTELEGLSQAEAAARVGISLSGMKSRVQRGRRMLRRQFEACCDFDIDARGRVVDYDVKLEPCACKESPRTVQTTRD